MSDDPQPRKRYEWEQSLIDALVVGERDGRNEKVAIAERVIRSRISELIEASRNYSEQPDLFDEFLALHEALRTLAAMKRLS